MSVIQSNENESAFSIAELRQQLEQAQQEMSEYVCRELETRYGKKFSVDSMIFDPGIGRTKLVARPADEQLPFFVTVTGETEFGESYVCALCQDKLRNALSEALPGTAVNVVLLDDGEPEVDMQLSLEGYIRQHNVQRAVVRIAAEKNVSPDKSAVLTAVQGASRFFNVSVALHFWLLDHEGFQRCRQAFQSIPSVSASIVRSCDPLDGFSVLVEDGMICSPERSDMTCNKKVGDLV